MNLSKTKFKGMHHRMALQNHIEANPGQGLSFELRERRYSGQSTHDPSTPHNPDLPYECKPVILDSNGNIVAKKGNSAGGKTSMFPDSWNEQRIFDEVEYAIVHNEGKVDPDLPYLKGWSRPPNPIEIHIGVRDNGEIFSYFPFIKN